MSVTFDPSQISPHEMLERVRDTGAPVTQFGPTREAPLTLGAWLQVHLAEIEVICTGLTFVSMIAGWLAPRLGAGQPWTNVFFTIAYVAGGIFGVQASFRSLRQWTKSSPERLNILAVRSP